MMHAVLVDDERPSLSLLRKMLEKSGKVVVDKEFTDPLAASVYLEEHPSDIVFLDVEMPEQDGIITANRLLDSHPRIPVVFVTGYTDYAVDAFTLNALDYLVKPISYERVLETIKRVSDQQKSRDADHGKREFRLSVKGFSKFTVLAAGESVHFRTRKAEELLAYLIDHEGAFVSRANLLDLLWGDFEGDRAMMNFNTTLHYVKKALAHYYPKPVIEFDQGRYRVLLEHLDCDFIVFKNYIRNTVRIDRSQISEAVGVAHLYTGSYMGSNEYVWSLQKALRLEGLYSKLIAKLFDAVQKTGQVEDSRNLLWTAAQAAPENERIHYLLLKVLLSSGETVEARRLYEAYSDRIRRHFGNYPSEMVQSLFSR